MKREGVKRKLIYFSSFLLSIVRRGKFRRDRRRDEDVFYLRGGRCRLMMSLDVGKIDGMNLNEKELLSALNKRDEFEKHSLRRFQSHWFYLWKAPPISNPISTRHTKLLDWRQRRQHWRGMRNSNISIFIKSFRAGKSFSIFPHDDNATTLTMSMAQYWSEEPAWHDVVPERLFIIILCYFSLSFLFHSSDYEKGFFCPVKFNCIFAPTLNKHFSPSRHKLPLVIYNWPAGRGTVLCWNSISKTKDWPNIQI